MPWIRYTDDTDSPSPDEITYDSVVYFHGGYHYASSNADTPSGSVRSAGTAKVTNIARGARHPYHLVAVSGSGSNVYGWVDASQISVIRDRIEAGSAVKIKPGAYIYGTERRFAPFVYEDIWIVRSISGDRAVLDRNLSGTNSIDSPVAIDDLISV